MLLFRPLRSFTVRPVGPLLRHLATLPDIHIEGPPYRVLSAGQRKHVASLRDRSEVEISGANGGDAIRRRTKNLFQKSRRLKNKVKKILPSPPLPVAFPQNERQYNGHAEFQTEIASVLTAYKDHVRIRYGHNHVYVSDLFREALFNRLDAFKETVNLEGNVLEQEDVHKIAWRLYYDFVKLPIGEQELVVARALSLKVSPNPMTAKQEDNLMPKVMAKQEEIIRAKLGKAHPKILLVDAEMSIFREFFRYFFERRRQLGAGFNERYGAEEIINLWNRFCKRGKKHLAIHLPDAGITVEEMLKDKLRGKTHLKR